MKVAIAALVLSGCIIGDDGDKKCNGGKCDGTGESCNDKRYNDGKCDVHLECAAPDIDCFDIFKDDAEAATWFGKFEEGLAMEEGRPPRKFLTPADPRWAKTRDLLDRGWEACKKNRPVGLLAEKRPGLVMLEDPTPNAFVAPNITFDKAGFTVMVQTGLFEIGGDDDGALGVMMHEFQHAIGLHVIGDTRERLKKFYFASPTTEPIGKYTADDQVARRYGESWKTLADSVGSYDDENLRALPMGGEIVQILAAAIKQAGTSQATACMNARVALGQLATEAMMTVDALTGDVNVSPSLAPRVDEVMDDVKYDCFADFESDLIDVMATAQNVSRDQIIAAMDPADVALVEYEHIIDGFSALLLDRRAKMRQLESELATKAGKQWEYLRFFSDEEDADDVSVIVLRGAKVDPPNAIGKFLTLFLPDEAQPICNDMLANRQVPPYGHDLTDEHHSFCWRAHHARQLAEHLEEDADSAARATAANEAKMPSFPPPRPLPVKPRLRDRLRY
jgi:hypothetical protein